MKLSQNARQTATLVALFAVAAYLFRTYTEMLSHPERTLFEHLWRQARYFTYLTTLMIAYSFARFGRTGRARPDWAAALAMWAAIIGVVYHALLARDLRGLEWWADHGLHTVLPIAVVLWWIRFAPKTSLKRGHSAQWLIWPALYSSYALIRGEVDGRHPYFFLDPPLVGWPTVIAYAVGLMITFWLTVLALIMLSKRIR